MIAYTKSEDFRKRRRPFFRSKYEYNMVKEAVKEMGTLPTYREKPIIGVKPPRCVDGRESEDSKSGPQMLGGTTHVILLDAIYNDKDFDEETVSTDIATLQSAGFETGAHRGSHAHGESSDCGFADKLKEILQKAIDKRQEITKRLFEAFEANKANLGDLQNLPIEALINDAYDKITAYSQDKIKITGEDLVRKIESSNSKVETAQGEHAEQIAFLNIKPGTTLDTNNLNQQGEQGFNLDINEPIKEGTTFNIPQGFILSASVIFYQATEMVLVEDKGKPALSVQIHS